MLTKSKRWLRRKDSQNCTFYARKLFISIWLRKNLKNDSTTWFLRWILEVYHPNLFIFPRIKLTFQPTQISTINLAPNCWPAEYSTPHRSDRLRVWPKVYENLYSKLDLHKCDAKVWKGLARKSFLEEDPRKNSFLWHMVLLLDSLARYISHKKQTAFLLLFVGHFRALFNDDVQGLWLAAVINYQSYCWGTTTAIDEPL